MFAIPPFFFVDSPFVWLLSILWLFHLLPSVIGMGTANFMLILFSADSSIAQTQQWAKVINVAGSWSVDANLSNDIQVAKLQMATGWKQRDRFPGLFAAQI